MDQSDRELISGLFDRMKMVSVDKDQEAEGVIHGLMRQDPDSPYLLVQTALIQEHALENADARIRELEQEIERLRQDGPAKTTAPKASPGFTGAATAAATVPAADAPAPWEAQSEPRSEVRPTTSVPSTGAGSVKESSGWWGSKPAPQTPPAPPTSNAAASSGTRTTPPPYTGPVSRQGPGARGMSVPPSPASSAQQNRTGNGQTGNGQTGSGMGGFMRQAATTAAGVAGGVLIANSLSGMFGGNSSSSSTPSAPSGTDKPAETAAKPEEGAQSSTDNQTGDGQMQEASDSNSASGAEQQPAAHEAAHEDGGWDDNGWGGDDSWGGDFEI